MNNLYEKVEAGEFRAGMKVLVVDNDPQSLTLHENVLTQLAYDVTTCSQAKDALKLLREKKRSFDLIFVDVNILDMDCCTLLKHIKEEMNLPSIMMLGDENISSMIMQGIAHGACDFVIKPMNEDHAKTIWHHAARKKYIEKLELEGGLLKNEENGSSSNGAATEEIGKKKSSSEDESTNPAITTAKRPRFVWTEDRKQKFENAVNLIGLENAVPKTILQVMNDNELTREIVASHLQKYRLNLKRSQPDVRTSSSTVPPIPNQSPGQPIMLQSSQYPMQRSRSHFPLGQSMVLHHQTISQSNNSGYYLSNESIARPSNTMMNMQSYSTQSHADVNIRYGYASTNRHRIPSTSYANNCNLLPRWYSNFMPTPQISGGDVNTIGSLSGQPASRYLGGDANNMNFVGECTDSRQRQVENSSIFETSTVIQRPYHSNPGRGIDQECPTGLGFAGTEILNRVQVESNMTNMVDEDAWVQTAFDFHSYLKTEIPMIR